MKIRHTVAPVGYRLPIGTLFRAASTRLRPTDRAGEFLSGVERVLQVRSAFGVSSGKAALTLILRALASLSSRTKVIIPAYTCFSVPSAIVKAGLDVVPCDVAAGSFDYDYARLLPMLQSDVLCVLSVDLFGIPADTGRLNEACRKAGILVVEDAAQAFGGVQNGKWLGTRGDVGFFSLGRGKNITCGSGGIIVTSNSTIAGAVRALAVNASDPSLADDISTLLMLMAVSALLSPRLYWLPSGLPFLKLGETIFHEDFPVQKLSSLQAALLRDWPDHLKALDAIRREHAAYYLSHLTGAVGYGSELPYLRFPVLLPDGAVKRRLLADDAGTALGLSGMYPTSIGAIRQLETRLAETRFPQADRLAETLITLPTHPLLSHEDRERICAAVNAAIHDAPRYRNAGFPDAMAQVTVP